MSNVTLQGVFIIVQALKSSAGITIYIWLQPKVVCDQTSKEVHLLDSLNILFCNLHNSSKRKASWKSSCQLAGGFKG